MIGIIDYGVGNLFSLRRSLEYVGAEAVVSGDEAVLRSVGKLILPGVGAFGDAAAKLRATGLDRLVLEEAAAGKPLLGICLGMQLLFEESEEYGLHKGLGLLPGRVVAMEGRLPAGLPIPHIGWNGLILTNPACPLFRDTKDGDCVYFVHSYYAEGCGDALAATAEYGLDLTATVWRDNVYGCQFHPEKSGPVGLAMLRAFVEV
ncbi:MAG TPA: imidazole glycerol phosphate synthase subunit HisH [Candidatus Avoscillospira stercorigallinarum]|uniref:Imidazole glycerol phosphate synthase subunit HisH n=1 Tax=Candidatus Avoscillospira stercorigallinarum TaxID=2840708 RepID=A0A9D0Z6J2_9FIRM|nr:imidazole glycerol phosphate synthase subunit HisH [Candidatus Avoscillospira stercorigallinarum]